MDKISEILNKAILDKPDNKTYMNNLNSKAFTKVKEFFNRHIRYGLGLLTGFILGALASAIIISIALNLFN